MKSKGLKPMTSDEVRRIRDGLNVSQVEFARLCGVKAVTVIKQENGGKVRPSLVRLYRLLDRYRDEAIEFLGMERKQRLRGPRRRWRKGRKT